jgi:hypothetical protein
MALRPSVCRAETTARENVAETFAKIPGYGVADIYYPNSWEGLWAVEQSITNLTIYTSQARGNPLFSENSNDQPVLSTLAMLQGLMQPISYERLYTNYNGRVILDRATSETNYQRAVNRLGSSSRESVGDYANSIARWSASNTNILTLSAPSGNVIEYKVTKRATEKLPDGQVGYSEYLRVAEAPPDGLQYSVPQLYGMRRLARYKAEAAGPGPDGVSGGSVPPGRITGLERLYLYRGDTIDTGGSKSNVPLCIVKSSLTMTRKGT